MQSAKDRPLRQRVTTFNDSRMRPGDIAFGRNDQPVGMKTQAEGPVPFLTLLVSTKDLALRTTVLFAKGRAEPDATGIAAVGQHLPRMW